MRIVLRPPFFSVSVALKRTSIAAVGLLFLSACPAEPGGLALPPPDDDFLLGAAGAPQPLFGSAQSPTFADGFDALAADGFNRFVPVFLTDESGAGTGHETYFLPPAALPGVPTDVTCVGSSNPWSAAVGRIEIVLPSYLLVLDQSVTDPLDTVAARPRFEAFLADCLGGDAGRAPHQYLYDEPSSNYLGMKYDGLPGDFVLGNVASLAAVGREVLGSPTMIVEAAGPFAFPYLGVPPGDIPQMETEFWQAVDLTAPVADLYGFDLYPVDLTTDLSPVGTYVDHARARAPAAIPIAVLQGFGFADMGIPLGTTGRRPTRAETRAMAFLAITHGARGLFWYGQSALTVDDVGVWDPIREVVRDLRRLSGVLMLPDATVTVGNAQVAALAKQSEDALWLFLVNPVDAPQTVTVALPNGASCVVNALTGSTVAAVEGGEFTYELAGYESLVVGVCGTL